ncbi:uncharacterized protein DNG_09629 [Cephalotrichum gorgonifer]|uniref:Uncharacterized protein n=1 Tax=Cephalotrichum gorgonifer TaxID=2041049 RepID=A0AAE8N624_9PEZI|nr:uncharacterized protein DNG_09629 [Cephalotrichum gorgonifer]
MTWDTNMINHSGVNGNAVSNGSSSLLRAVHDIVINVPSKGVIHVTEPGPDDFHKLGVWTTWAVKIIAGSYIRYWGYEGGPVLPITINPDGTFSMPTACNITFANVPIAPSWKVTLGDITSLQCIYAGSGSDSPPVGAATSVSTIARQVYRKDEPHNRMSILTRTTVNGKLGLTLLAGASSTSIDANLGVGVNVQVSIAANLTYSVTADGAAAVTGTLGHTQRYCASADGTDAGAITLKNVPAVARPPPGPPISAPEPPAGTDVYTVTFNVSVTRFPDPLTINGQSVTALAPVAGTVGRHFAVDSNGSLYFCFKRKANIPWNYSIGSVAAGTSYALTIVQVSFRNWLIYVNGRNMNEEADTGGGLFNGSPSDPAVIGNLPAASPLRLESPIEKVARSGFRKSESPDSSAPTPNDAQSPTPEPVRRSGRPHKAPRRLFPDGASSELSIANGTNRPPKCCRIHQDDGCPDPSDRRIMNAQKTIDFDDVYQSGKATDKHTIAKYPKSSGVWFILKCEEHGMHFCKNPVRGAARHLVSKLHGRMSMESSVAIRELSICMLGCDADKAERNNDAFLEAVGRRYEVPRRELEIAQ